MLLHRFAVTGSTIKSTTRDTASFHWKRKYNHKAKSTRKSLISFGHGSSVLPFRDERI
jgi:hypothetical protein